MMTAPTVSRPQQSGIRAVLLTGGRNDLESRVMHEIDEKITLLAADYYKANP